MNHRILLLFCPIVLLNLSVRRVHAEVFRVDNLSTATNPDGSNWTDECFKHLQDALAAAAQAQGPHTIRVAQGIYHPDEGGNQTTGDRAASFAMLNFVMVHGGYHGIAALPGGDPDEQDPSLYVTILSGDLDDDDDWATYGFGDANRAENSYTVVKAESVNSQAVLEDVIITDAESFAENNIDGGGVYVFNSQAQFINCTIRRCRVGIGRSGGGMFSYIADPTISGCRLEDNEAGTGGGLASDTVAIGLIVGSVFQNCVATGRGGGGMSVHHSEVTTPTRVNDSQFIDNRHVPDAEADPVFGGGGILLWDRAAAVLRGCSITENVAEDTPGGGAMVDPATHYLHAINCVFDGNESTYDSGAGGKGGGLYAAATTKIISCLFSNNIGEGDGDTSPLHGGGGAYYDEFTDGYIVNTLFRDNTARNGAGLLLIGSEISVVNCTVVQNTAANIGGGVFAKKVTAGTVFLPTVTNAIVWDNASTNGSSEQQQFWTDRLSSDPVVLTHSCLQDMDTGGVLNHATNTTSDPLFRNPAADDFRLSDCSPVIDRGNTLATEQDELNADLDAATTCSGSCTNGERTPDLNLQPRVVEAVYSPGGGGVAETQCVNGCGKIVDMGAYEHQGFCEPDACLRGDVNGDGDVNGLDVQPYVACLLGASSLCDCSCADMDLNGVIEHHVDTPIFVAQVLIGDGLPGCGTGATLMDCNGNEIPDAVDIANCDNDPACGDCNANGIPDECDIANETSADANENGIPDECESDCNGNEVPDEKDIADETSADLNGNGVPDECEPDCNANGIPDDMDVDPQDPDGNEEVSADCNENGIPDECEPDCNENGVPDDCDIDPLDPDGDEWVSPDCNANGWPDECDLSLSPAFGGSLDCNENGKPDECDIAECESDPACADCNENGIPDGCDIESELSEDANENGVPDECEQQGFMGGGGQSLMGGGGEGGGMSPEELAEAWEAFFDWCDAQTWGPNSAYSGSEQFSQLVGKLNELGLPLMLPMTP